MTSTQKISQVSFGAAIAALGGTRMLVDGTLAGMDRP